MSERDIPGPNEWEAWSPEQTAASLEGSGVEWAVAGGWALDLARGTQSRPHKDIEIVVCEAAFPTVRAHLRAYPFFAAAGGRLTRADAAPQAGPASRQHWVLDPNASKWRLDVMLEPGDEQHWIYRRDPRITAARTQVIARSHSNVPYLRPHVVLLFKARQSRPADQRDFDASLGLLERAERQWLRDAIRLTDAGHHWLQRLE